jgi:hypothetical protein
MVPQTFVKLSALPLSENGKVDRRALGARPIARPRSSIEAAQRERTRCEDCVARIWQELLGLPELPQPHETFFQLGGNSLLAMRCLNRVNSAFGIGIGIGEVYARSELAAFAALVERHTLLQRVAVDAPASIPLAAELEQGFL